MAKEDYILQQTGEQVQEILNKADDIGPASQSKAGLMSAEDKTKLDGITPGDLATKQELAQKQDTIADLAAIRSGASAGSTALQSADLEPITEKIPAQASAQNQLADKAFVNSSIATATAEFKGTYQSLEALQAVTADNNDYGYVVSTDQAGNTVYNRYKYNGSAWVFEYSLNNSSFTAAEWTAIQSGITQALVQKLGALPTNDGLQSALSGKQDVIADLSAIRSGATAGATAYQKPSGGIPGSDIASGVIPSVPTISADISADALSDSKTVSPKAVKEYVDEMVDGEFIEAWDGSSEPVVANIPSGVSVEYNSTTYTGTLSASASTKGKVYLVSDGNGEYDRYKTSYDGTNYFWSPLGSTAMNLSGYATEAEVTQLQEKVVEKDTLFVDSRINYFNIEDLSIETQGADITYSVSEGVLTIVNAGANNQNLGIYLPDTISGKVFVLKVNASPARSVILYKGVSTDYEVLSQDGTEYSIEYSGNSSGYWFRITVGNNKTCVVSSITLEEKNPDQYINPELVKEIDEDSFSEEYREKQAKLFSNGNIFDVETATIIGVGSKITYTRENNTLKVASSGSGAGNNYINIGLPNTKTGKIYTLSFRATNTTGTMDLYRGFSEIVESVSAINDVYTVVFPGGYDYLIKLTVSNNKTSIMSEFNLIDNEMAGKTFVNPKAMMYDNGNSTLTATLVNDAIDELDQNMHHRIFDNDYNAQVNNRLANPLYETLEHYNTEHPDSPIVVEDVLVRGVIPAEARRYRIPTTIITNASTYLVAAEHRGDVVAGDATDASIHLARKEAGSNIWEYQNIIPFINYTTSYGRTYDPAFVIDRTGENTGVEGRIFLFGGMSTNDGSWLTDTEETNDLMYKYSDDDGETWSALVSVKSIVDYTKIDCILTSPNNGIQMADGTLVVPCFCSLKTDGAFKCSTVLLIKENADSWKLSSITPSDFNIAECAIVETEDGKILLAARTTANFGSVNEETRYSFLWEYDVDSDTWQKKNSTFIENSGCQWSLTKAVLSINGTPTTVYIKSAVDSVNALRTNITIWASLDLDKWIRVYRVYAPAGNGYSVVDFYDDKMVVAYETSVDNYSISFQDISDVLDIVNATTENYLVGNVCVQDMLQYIINLLRN